MFLSMEGSAIQRKVDQESESGALFVGMQYVQNAGKSGTL